MATESKKTIKASGGDYASLNAWEAGEQADLVTGDIYAVASIEGSWASADTAALTIYGWTTDATRYIEIRTSGDARHNGAWSTSAYRLEPTTSSQYCISQLEDYVRLDGLQLTAYATTNYASAIRVYSLTASSNDVRISNCILTSQATVSDIGIYTFDANPIIKTWNCVFFNFDTNSTSYAIRCSGGTHNVYNCTAYNSGAYGFYHASGTLNCYNCISQSAVTAAFTGTVGGDYNLSDDTSAPGTNSVHNSTLTFINPSSGDFHLAATDTDAIDATSDQSGGLFSDDIDGQTRTGSWDIGADERLAGGAISGSAALTVAPAGTLRAEGALAGAAAATFAASASPAGLAQASGASACQAAATGDLAGLGILAGSAQSNFTGTSDASGKGALQASTTATFSGSATARADGQLAGSAPVTISPTGTLSELGGNELAGTIACTFSASAELAGHGQAAGTATATFAQTGDLAGTASLAGTIPATTTATGTIKSGGGLAGSAPLSISHLAQLEAMAALAGLAALDIGLAGICLDQGSLYGPRPIRASLATVQRPDREATLQGKTRRAFVQNTDRTAT